MPQASNNNCMLGIKELLMCMHGCMVTNVTDAIMTMVENADDAKSGANLGGN